jgi:heme-degrading monooxygenase HmoA
VGHLVLVRPVHFPPGREGVGLEWLRGAMVARERAGMLRHAIMRSRTDRHDYLAVMVWPDQDTYQSWHASGERERLFADQPHYLVREPTRRYTLLDLDDCGDQASGTTPV